MIFDQAIELLAYSPKEIFEADLNLHMPSSGVRIVNAEWEHINKASLSLSGCGFLCIYHAGVCAAIKEHAPQLLQNRISGASAGSIIAAGVICNICISQATNFFLNVVSEARSYTFGALNRDFDLMKLVRTKLNDILPSNAHELCTGHLRISVTRFRDMENVILDDFRTKDELIDAICCSCFIPVYGGFVYPTFRGEIYIDGGASDNQPVIDTNTITVSPFSGESDICPTDEESASLFEWNFTGTSIRLTANNLYRAALCLFPPSAEECVSMCQSGFNDTLKFLAGNGFTSNAVCLSVEMDLSTKLNQVNKAVGAATSSYCAISQESYENEKIAEYIDSVPTTKSIQLPQSMQSDDWHSMRVKHILDFILNEIHSQEAKVSARLSQQLAITEVEYSRTDGQLIIREQLDISLSSEAIREREVLNNIDRLLSKTALRSAKPLSERLYGKTNECLEAHVTELYQEISAASDSELLNTYCQLWNVYYKGALCVHNLFGYLNKQYIKIKRCTEIEGGYGAYSQYLTQKDVKEIGLLAMEIWRKKLIDPMEKRLVGHLLSAIAADREGRNIVPVDTVRGAIMSFVQVDDVDSMREVLDKSPSNLPQNYETYREMFEKKFMQTTTEYYTVLSIKLLSELSCSQYMESVITRIEEEKERSIRFLHKSSYEKVTKLCQDVMVDAHKERLYAVCHEYIEGECMNDLHNMYRILKPINGGLSVVIREFQNFVKKTGLETVKDMHGDNMPQQFVENVLQVYNRFSTMVTKVYYDDGDFVGALDKALQTVVNYRDDPRQAPKASERLARYTDTLLRKSGKGLSDSELDTKLSQAIIIFRYIEDKDIFQKFYSKMLANRLITNASLSKDAEESMISKLKQACGFEFTSKLSRMFTDVGLSHELTDKFISYCAVSNVTLNVQMTVLILQAGAWPLSVPSSIPTFGTDGKDSTTSTQVTGFIVPPVLLPSIEHFERYYQASHNGRKLTWLFNLANVELKLLYLDKVYQVTMSVHQLAILMCFETRDSVTLSYIEKATGLSDELLSRNTRALVDSGVLIMAKKEMNEVNDVALNLTLTSKRLRFKVLVPQLQRNAEKEAEHLNITAQQDRKYYMECTIVRIMKTRKVLKHAALVNEVIEQTKSRFTPDVNFIKKNIESLIEKLYIQRTDQNDEYQYLA